MCSIPMMMQEIVKSKLNEVLQKGLPFTGQDIFELMKTQGDVYRSQISSYVRELFNRGKMPGWASTQVIPEKGPVLYFKVPDRSLAGLAAKKIRKILDAPQG